MKLRRKILIDRVIGLPMVFFLNGICRVLGKILNRNHSVAPESVRVIAVAKFFGMGSIVQATSVLRSLRERFPHAVILFVTSAQNRALMERLGQVEAAIYVDDSGPVRLFMSTAAAVTTLIRWRVDLYFDLEVYSAFATLMALLCVARNRFGFYRYSTTFKEGIYTHLLYFNARLPIRRIYLQLGLAAGAHDLADDRIGPVRVTDADRAGFLRKWAGAGGEVDAAYTVINPNASDLLLERRWPAKSFVVLIEGLVARGHRVALSGAPSEAAYVNALLGMLSPGGRAGVHNMAGLLTLGEFLAMIDGARCVVTNDTGPMHFAIALGRPTVCLFGPCSPDHYGFQSGNVEILYRRVFCSPCVHEIAEPPCGGNNICMQLIEPAMVLAAAERLLGGDVARVAMPESEVRHSRTTEFATADASGRPLGLVVRASIQSEISAMPVPSNALGTGI
jgi:ADP-heptose:LPS heptosyltransferase